VWYGYRGDFSWPKLGILKWPLTPITCRKSTFAGSWPRKGSPAETSSTSHRNSSFSMDQAERVVSEFILNPRHFYTEHPIPVVSVSDQRFELRMWRGPTWNSTTYWTARGCVNYGFSSAARNLLEKALDASAQQFARTGTVWEFYHPHVGNQLELLRKPHTGYNTPCRDYLGHNPLIAMARLWTRLDQPKG
jgi:hypothetical protein